MTTSAAGTPRARRVRADSAPRIVAGSLFVAAIVVVSAVAAWPIYRSAWFLLLVTVAAVVAAGIAVAARVRRWDGWMTAVAVAGGFLGTRVPVALPSRSH